MATATEPESKQKNKGSPTVQDAQKHAQYLAPFETELEQKIAIYTRLRILAIRARGATIRLDPDGKIQVGNPGVLTEQDRAALREHRELFARILYLGDCRECGKLLDPLGCCWKCCNRRCLHCDGWTGSAFIRLCIACGFAEEQLEKGGRP